MDGEQAARCVAALAAVVRLDASDGACDAKGAVGHWMSERRAAEATDGKMIVSNESESTVYGDELRTCASARVRPRNRVSEKRYVRHTPEGGASVMRRHQGVHGGSGDVHGGSGSSPCMYCTGPSEPDNPPRRKTPPRRVVGTHLPGPVHEHPSWPKRQLLAQLGGSRATLESYTGVGALATRPARLGAPTCPVSHRPHSPGVLVATTPFILQPPASSRSDRHSITVLQRCSAATRTGDSCSPILAPKRPLGPIHLLEYFTVRMHSVG